MDGQALIEAMVAWWVQNETGTAQEAMAADLLIHATSRAFAESVPDATARVSAMIDEARHGLAEAKTDVIRVATAY